MRNYGSLSHTKWECQYHVVFIPKYRQKRIQEYYRLQDAPAMAVGLS